MELKTYIKDYYKELELLKKMGAKTEGQTRRAFEDLLKKSSREYSLVLISEDSEKTKNSKNIRYDGSLYKEGRKDFKYGNWEAKDESDIIDEEIRKKEIPRL